MKKLDEPYKMDEDPSTWAVDSESRCCFKLWFMKYDAILDKERTDLR